MFILTIQLKYHFLSKEKSFHSIILVVGDLNIVKGCFCCWKCPSTSIAHQTRFNIPMRTITLLLFEFDLLCDKVNWKIMLIL